MSIETAKKFIHKVGQEPELRQALTPEGKSESEFVDNVVRKGQDEGFSFTAADCREALREVTSEPADGELSEADLAGVGGGASTFRYVIGKVWGAISSDTSDSGSSGVAGVRS